MTRTLFDRVLYLSRWRKSVGLFKQIRVLEVISEGGLRIAPALEKWRG